MTNFTQNDVKTTSKIASIVKTTAKVGDKIKFCWFFYNYREVWGIVKKIKKNSIVLQVGHGNLYEHSYENIIRILQVSECPELDKQYCRWN